MAQKIVGLDIGNYSLKAVVLESTYRGWELIGFHEMKIASDYVTVEAMIDQTVLKEEDESPETENESVEEVEVDEEEQEEPQEEDEIDPDRLQLRMLIERFVKKYGQDWNSIFTAFSSDRLSVKYMDFPFVETRQIDATLAFSLEEVVPFDISDKIIDYQVIRKEPGNSRIIAGILDRKSMREYLEDFTDTGHQAKAVSIDFLALGDLFRQLSDESDIVGSHALLDIGHRKTTICIVDDGEITFGRTIPLGGQDLTQALAKEFDLNFEEAQRKKHREGFVRSPDMPSIGEEQSRISDTLESALIPIIRQIGLTFQAHTSAERKKVDRIHLIGGGSKLNNLPEHLSERLGLPVAPYDYLKSEFNRLDDTEDRKFEMASGLGMAFYGLSGTRMKRLNFRKEEFAYKGDFDLWKGRIAQLAANMAFVFLFIFMNIASQFHVLGADDDRMEESISSACRSILGKEVSDAKICISQMMEVIGGKGQGTSKLLPSVSILTLYDELVSRMTQDELSVDISEIELTSKRIKVKGEVDAIPTAGQIVDNLKGYKCFSNISQGPTRKNVKGDRVDFSLAIMVECDGKKKQGGK